MKDGVERLLQVWVSFRLRQEFLVVTEFLVLCRDRVLISAQQVLL